MTTLEIPPAKQKGDLLSAIGDTLRAERTEKGLTLKQVAEGAHVSVSYLAEKIGSTRLNSSHANISYAVFCLKKKKQDTSDIISLLAAAALLFASHTPTC